MDDREMDELLELACTRDLSATLFPVVHLGAFYSKYRTDESVAYRTVVMATGVTDEGDLEPIGVAAGDSEEPTFWARFLLSLKARGLEGVRVVASGEHGGLKEALEAVFPSARWHPAELLEELAEDAPALLDLRVEEDIDTDSGS